MARVFSKKTVEQEVVSSVGIIEETVKKVSDSLSNCYSVDDGEIITDTQESEYDIADGIAKISSLRGRKKEFEFVVSIKKRLFSVYKVFQAIEKKTIGLIDSTADSIRDRIIQELTDKSKNGEVFNKDHFGGMIISYSLEFDEDEIDLSVLPEEYYKKVIDTEAIRKGILLGVDIPGVKPYQNPSVVIRG
jgi:hypothetical protein